MGGGIKKLAGQTAIYGLSSVVVRLLNYLLVPLYTRVFHPGEYGVVTEFYAYVTFLIIILTYGMETGFFRFSQNKSEFDKTYSTSLTSIFFTSALFIVLINIFAQPIASMVEHSQHPEWIRWFSFILAFDAFSAIPFAKLRQQNKAWRFATIKIINIGINIGFNLFFLLLCPAVAKSNPDALILQVYNPAIGVGYIFISNLLASSITLLLLLPDVFDVKFHFDRALLRKMLWYSFPLLIGGLAGMVNETIDRILLKYMLPGDQNHVMSELGIYGANYKLSIMMTLFIQMFRYAAEPFFFSEAKSKHSKNLFAEVMTYFIIFGLVIFLGITGYIDVVKYFIDAEYHEGLSVVPILLIANLFLGIYFNLSVWYKLNNQTKYGAWMAIVGALITLVLNIILIPYISYMGSAIATLVCYVSMAFISYYLGQKHFPIPYNLKKIGLYAVIAAVIYVLFSWTNQQTAWIKYITNTVLIAGFIIFAIKNEHLITRIRQKDAV
ncbi:MAG: oligosaccharide flippase family protein [Bacteroidota bacterium]|nr:oligosaccharide flippase family protein [Bacteroidota bacterium]